MKIFSFLALLAMPFTGYAQQKIFNITDYGAKADGITNNTISIQKAIDNANAQGGGIVHVPAGKFLTGVINLKSNVTLNLAANAVLLGSAKRIDYGEGHASPLIFAKDQQHIGITGKGTIDGNGDELLKDLFAMLKAGKLRDSLWQKTNPWGQIQPEEPNRPKLIGFFNCTGIQVKGITIQNGLVWIQDYNKCRDMVIDSIKVVSNTYWNNDGIDLVDCKNVKLTNSFFNADDDGICLKSSDRNSCCENIYIAKCTTRSSASGIKFGTASWGGFKKITIKDIKIYDTYRSAIALECVDGGVMEDINISNIHAINTGNAIFIRLGHRNKDTVVSRINGIRISNVTVDVPKGKPDKGYPMEGPEVKGRHNPFPSSIAGLPGHPVQNVTLQNIKIVYHGDASKTVARVSLDSLTRIPENPRDYPEFSMFGELPAWGFYARHAAGVSFKNVTLSCAGRDFRAACVFEDIDGLTLNSLKIPQVKSLPVIALFGVTKSVMQNILMPRSAKNKVLTK
ncbi:glycosyl hydrolase family 28 protein [Mucilaginibacter sp. KACC 22773]|uniref:glycoside hydrolase family 28 protein n=1 Tax=Mucilaginibacter sp. KACC 22773 TaxID=3025671 RepID=UPI0023653BC4|nr:glycosyl hydrolase family 28 protein [Mucilaginibacter sp. KACC 22773]WDF77312.1 glycosyl hydrolase family 28 protein [Mucilaginibacter sp. KACC 22773]